MGFPGGSVTKNLPANVGDAGSTPGLGGSPREGNDNTSILAGKYHGQRNLVGYSPWGHKTWDSGGGNGNPLQYSCLENPMDRQVWQAKVHKVAKSPLGCSVGHDWSDWACNHVPAPCSSLSTIFLFLGAMWKYEHIADCLEKSVINVPHGNYS